MQTGYQIAVHNPAYLLRPSSYMFFFIRLATGSYWNHWAGIEVKEGKVLVMEMRGRGKKRGIRKTSYHIWLARHKDRIFEILPYNPTSKQLKAIDSCKNIGYDFWSLLIWQPLFIISGMWLEPRKMQQLPYKTCSELWAHLLDLPYSYRMSPADMAAICKASRR